MLKFHIFFLIIASNISFSVAHDDLDSPTRPEDFSLTVKIDNHKKPSFALSLFDQSHTPHSLKLEESRKKQIQPVTLTNTPDLTGIYEDQLLHWNTVFYSEKMPSWINMFQITKRFLCLQSLALSSVHLSASMPEMLGIQKAFRNSYKLGIQDYRQLKTREELQAGLFSLKDYTHQILVPRCRGDYLFCKDTLTFAKRLLKK